MSPSPPPVPGFPGREPVELRRRFILVVVVTSGVLALFFVLYHLLVGHPERAWVSFSALVAAVLLLGVLKFTRGHQPATLVATVYAAATTLWLLASGDFPASDSLWCCVVPPLITYAGGLAAARWLLPTYYVAVAAIVLQPGFVFRDLWTQQELRPRFLGLLALVSVMAWVYEATRARAQRRLLAEVEERQAAQSNLAQANRLLVEAAQQATRLARRAEEASEAKTRFLSQMSHDIRTPLTGILGMAEMLELTGLDDRQQRYLRTIRVSGHALTELIGDILDLARIEEGRLEMRSAPIELAPFLGEVRTVVEPLALEKGLELVTHLDPALPATLWGDGARIRQILLNLAGNALKFTEKGRVFIGVRALEGSLMWRLTVEDTGPGIPPSMQRRIFERFNQVHTTAATPRKGSGLGLSICARLVELMGGSLTVHSVEGQGSTFHVDLPRVESGAWREGEEEAQRLPPPPPCRVLVVDDHETVRRVVVSLLSRAGHTVHEAADGLLALATLAESSFDAVFMDIQMPGLDGIETVRRLRSGSSGALTPQIPVVAMTALADPETRRLCLEVGMNAVVTKPVETGTLLAALARTVRGG